MKTLAIKALYKNKIKLKTNSGVSRYLECIVWMIYAYKHVFMIRSPRKIIVFSKNQKQIYFNNVMICNDMTFYHRSLMKGTVELTIEFLSFSLKYYFYFC